MDACDRLPAALEDEGVMVDRLSVLLVESWFDGSHKAWAEGYTAHSDHDVSLVTHPGRFWRWRLRGGAVTLAEAVTDHAGRHGAPDVLLVSGLVDLAAIVGLTRRSLPDTAVVLYLHENQVAYPRADARGLDVAFRTWTSLLAADAVRVNSHHHLATLRPALAELLEGVPDQPHTHLLDEVFGRVEVVPVGVELPPGRRSATTGTPVVLWNHRWDDDKNPARFVRALQALAAEGVEFDVILAGEDPWEGESRRRHAEELLGDRVVASGFADREQYLAHLAGADVVVSAADHEFFGVSVVEAIAAGCVPVLPNALSYPELVPPRYHSAALYEPGHLQQRLRDVLGDIDAARRGVAGLATAMDTFGWATVAPRMDADLLGVVAAVRSSP